MQWGSATVGRAGVWGSGLLTRRELVSLYGPHCMRAESMRVCAQQSHSSPQLGSRRSAVPCSVPHSCANEPLSLTSGPRLEESLPISTVFYSSWVGGGAAIRYPVVTSHGGDPGP